MTRKKLPRAIPPAPDALQSNAAPEPATPMAEAAAEPVPDAKKKSASRRGTAGSAAKPVSASRAAIKAPATPEGGGSGDDAAVPEEGRSAPASPPSAPLLPQRTDPGSRRRRAYRIVDRHTTYSALSCLVPLPVVDVAAVTVIVMRMAKVLSDHYRVPFEQAKVRAFVSGVIGGGAAPGLAALGAANAAKLIPGVQLIGLAVSSATAAAWTRSIGEMFVQVFETGAGRVETPPL